jgi:uncharacterized protein RhaS with RHS repeats
LNLYAYAENNPVSNTDPDGHFVPLLAGGAAALAPGEAAAIAALGTAAIGATVELAQEVGKFVQAKKETDKKIKDIELNPENWEKVNQKPDPKQPNDGKSIRELWRNKNTGDILEKHVLERYGKPTYRHPHYKEPEGW